MPTEESCFAIGKAVSPFVLNVCLFDLDSPRHSSAVLRLTNSVLSTEEILVCPALKSGAFAVGAADRAPNFRVFSPFPEHADVDLSGGAEDFFSAIQKR